MLGGARSTTRKGRLRAPYPVYPPERGSATVGLVFLDPGAFWIFQRQLELARQRLDRGTAALPRAFGFKSQVTNATAPWRDDSTDRAVIAAVGVILIEPPDHIRRYANEGAKCRRALDAVF